MRPISFLSLVLVMLASPAFPQAGMDTAFISVAIKNSQSLYQKAIGAQARLFNGSKYLAPEHTIEQHPFLSSEDWLTGSVFYDGEYFQNVPLMYDLTSGQLITEHLTSGQAIQLVWDKLDYFSIGDRYFEKIDATATGNTLPETEFYEILYSGKTRLVAKREKILREEIRATVIERSFEEKNRYFFFKNGTFFPVKSKASILKLMADKKTEMKRFLKQQRLPFAQNREKLLIRLAEHYDTLK